MLSKRNKLNRLIFVIFIICLFLMAKVFIKVLKNNFDSGDLLSENRKMMMAQAESWVNIEIGRIERYKLDKLFNSQIQTLKSRNTPRQIVAMLENQRGAVVARALDMYFKNGHIPFLPVIPKDILSINAQMRMVKNSQRTGRKINHYDHPVVVTDMFETPERPYYIFDIEDGTATLNKSPLDAQNLINKQGRRGLTEVEVIGLAIHTDVLTRQTRHYLWAVGSRADEFADGTQDGVPSLDITGGRPELCWIEYVSTASYRGSPSSSKEMVAINILFY